MLSRAERRALIRKSVKKSGIKLTNSQKIELYSNNIQEGKAVHDKFSENAERINSELEGIAAYKIYEHFKEFYNDEEKALSEYQKIVEHKEK